MSRPLIRQRPRAEDDLQPAREEEKHKPPQVAPAAVKPATTSLGPERGAYFAGRYSPASEASPMSFDMLIARRMAEFGVPDSLHHCVMELFHVLRKHGIVAALAALPSDPAIDARHQGSVGRLLATVAESGAAP